jgi:hypothetical protein
VRRCITVCLPLLGLLACAPPEPPVTDIVAGITLRDGTMVTTEDHLVEVVVHEGHLYVANSNLAAGAVRLEPDGTLTLTDEGENYSALIRCTSLTVHAPSDTLYCANDRPFNSAIPTVRIADISTPGRIEWRDSFELEGFGTRDLEVVGDRLLIQQFHEGLWTADISPSGELSGLTDTGVSGNARVSKAIGDRVVTLFGDVEGTGAELRLFSFGRAGMDDWTELDRMSLSGPPLGLSVDAGGGPRAAVGLGSGGMALIDVEADELRLARMFEPPAVVTQGLVDGPIVAAVTLSGVFAWSLDDADPEVEPRAFGFGASAQAGHKRAGNMLHGLFHEGELITTDWLFVERWALDPDGEIVELDLPRGVYVGPEGPIRWRVRNPGALSVRAEFWANRKPVLEQIIEPGEVVELEIPEQQRNRVLAPEDPSTQMFVRVYDPAVPSNGFPLSSSAIVLVQRDPDATLPPATGDTFPQLRLAELDLEQVYDFPLPEGSQTIWMWPDCAMIWPQLEDLAWLGRQGVDLGRGTPVFIAEFDLESDDFSAQWGLDGIRFGIWGPPAPAEVNEANQAFGDNLYDPFFIPEMPGDAMPTDYVIDEAGTILSIERMYRGPWTLAVPWPWD